MAWFRIGGVRIGSYKRGVGGSIRGKKFGFGGSIDVDGIAKKLRAEGRKKALGAAIAEGDKQGFNLRPLLGAPEVRAEFQDPRQVEPSNASTVPAPTISPALAKPKIFAPGDRPVSVRLAIGIVVAPALFAWFTLRRGYPGTARIAAFAWAVAMPIVLRLQHSADETTPPAPSQFDHYGTREVPPASMQPAYSSPDPYCAPGTTLVHAFDKATRTTSGYCVKEEPQAKARVRKPKRHEVLKFSTRQEAEDAEGCLKNSVMEVFSGPANDHYFECQVR